MSQAELKLASIVSQPFGENTYVAWLAGSHQCVVFDPGYEPDKIFRCFEDQKLEPAAILNTHGHLDHIAGNGALKERWPGIPLVIGSIDAPMLTDPEQNLSAVFPGMEIVSPPADVLLEAGDPCEVAGLFFETRLIPGHSPGHLVFIWRGPTRTVVFGGDVLMAGSIGRTDFPGGNTEQLLKGIREQLFTLPEDTLVLPGHGGPTTIGEEKESNPYVGTHAKVRMRP